MFDNNSDSHEIIKGVIDSFVKYFAIRLILLLFCYLLCTLFYYKTFARKILFLQISYNGYSAGN